MPDRAHNHGFTLVELLLVLAIIGIISAIAIPALLGQRKRAQRIGDAESNARVICMALETYKSDNGTYGPANATATWTPSSATPTLVGYTVNPAPTYNPVGNTQMTYTLNAQPLAYVLMVTMGSTQIISIDQTGSKTLYLK